MHSFPDHTFSLATSTDSAGDVSITITGDLDYDTSDELLATAERQLERRPAPRHLRLDCARLAGCDSAGLSILLMIRRRADVTGTRLHLDNRPAALERVLGITGTLAHFTDAPAPERPAPEQPAPGQP
ncbi:STAS domain-containing protein [Streptomyces marincola]|uniref:STAS domain-containing protein n=1 Tax=Streptomyces marincola TaxID=2878388 RepID=A0A1W7CRY4_9ACTN|nr:STAS domain-containing protein [Streptomyces marincola]ARQ67554.1 hypothetical protein CAG99_00780 [Streptomyces marincola]